MKRFETKNEEKARGQEGKKASFQNLENSSLLTPHSSLRKGFTLVEAMVLMLLFSIMLAASMPLISKRHTELKKVAHGMYVCSNNTDGTYQADGTYNNNGTYTEQLFKNDALVINNTTATSCTFTPPLKAEYFMIQVVGGGGGGGYPGAMTTGSTDHTTNSIDVSNPPGSISLPNSWLSVAEFTGSAGTLTISIPSASGGTGGGYSWGDVVCPVSPGYCQTYGASGTTISVADKTGVAIQYGNLGWSTVSSCTGYNGITDTNLTDIVATSGYDGRVGSASYYGNTYPTSSPGTPKGGNAPTSKTWLPVPLNGVGTTNAQPFNLSYASCSSPSYSPSYLYWYDYYRTQTWKYGLSGKGGDFDAKFYPSFRGPIRPSPGAGGAPGDGLNAGTGALSVYQGYTGSKSTVETIEAASSTLMKADGGIGGDGNKVTGAIRVDSDGGLLTKVGTTWYMRGTYDADAVSKSKQIMLVGGFMSDYRQSQVGDKGKGGLGGGTMGVCQSDSNYPYHLFVGAQGATVNKPYSPACGSFTGNTISLIPSTGTEKAYSTQRGTGGAVYIYW